MNALSRRFLLGVAALGLVLGAAPVRADMDDLLDDLNDGNLSQGQEELRERGFSKVYSDDDVQYWWSKDRKRCVRLDLDERRIESAKSVKSGRCKEAKKDAED